MLQVDPVKPELHVHAPELEQLLFTDPPTEHWHAGERKKENQQLFDAPLGEVGKRGVLTNTI